MNELYHPMIENTLEPEIVASLEQLTKTLKNFDLQVGWIDRNGSRFLDVHCYKIIKTTKKKNKTIRKK